MKRGKGSDPSSPDPSSRNQGDEGSDPFAPFSFFGYLCSSSSRPVAKLSISTSSAPPPSSSSGPKICPVNFSFSAFFPPSGLNTLRLRAGLASGPKFFRAGRSRSAAPGSEKSGAGPRIGGEGREPGAEGGLWPNEGRN